MEPGQGLTDMLLIREDQIEETALNNYSRIYVWNRIAQDATLIHDAKTMALPKSLDSKGPPYIKEAVIIVDGDDLVRLVQEKVLAKLETYRS